jgi:hypothetical protein
MQCSGQRSRDGQELEEAEGGRGRRKGRMESGGGQNGTWTDAHEKRRNVKWVEARGTVEVVDLESLSVETWAGGSRETK